MKYFISEIFVLINTFLLINSTSDTEFEEDFIHSFLIKSEKLKKSERLKSAGQGWLEKTAYKNAVAVLVENWTNQKLEFPELSQELGSTDRWYPPENVDKHTRDIALVSYSSHGSPDNKGTVSYLLEDSWPRLYIVLGWWSKPQDEGVEVVLSVADSHLEYNKLVEKELNGLIMKDKMRLYKGSQHYVVAVTCHKVGEAVQLVVSVIPKNLDVWAWEKYYKHGAESGAAATQRVVPRVEPTQSVPSSTLGQREELDEESDTESGIFERKDLLTPGESVLDHVGNKSERQVLAGLPLTHGVGIRIENWSRYQLTRPQVVIKYGKQRGSLPVTNVMPGNLEFAVLEQDQGATGVSAVVRWHIGDTDTVLSLMVMVPYSLHFWSTWAAVGLTKDNALPDFSAMYSGTPDSDWFVRHEMGHRLEFTNGDLILIVDSDASTTKPVVRLSVVPIKTDQVAKSIQYRLQGKEVPEQSRRNGREGDKSVLALSSSSASSQCYCPCMGAAGFSSHHCLARLLLALALVIHVSNMNMIRG